MFGVTLLELGPLHVLLCHLQSPHPLSLCFSKAGHHTVNAITSTLIQVFTYSQKILLNLLSCINGTQEHQSGQYSNNCRMMGGSYLNYLNCWHLLEDSSQTVASNSIVTSQEMLSICCYHMTFYHTTLKE